MYTPPAFGESDGHVLVQFMKDHPFATLIGPAVSGALLVTHVPVTVSADADGVQLSGHLARQNPHWRSFDGVHEAVVIFHGAHAYISPRWYNVPSVPTWNYAAVHAHGAPTVITDPAHLERDVRALVSRYERPPAGLDPDHLMDQFRPQLNGVTGFTMRVSRIEGKFKLSQNRSAADQDRVAAALLASDRAEDRACGALMLNRRGRPSVT